MLTAIVGWMKGLSVAGKVAMGLVGITTVGVMASPGSAPATINTEPEVKASQVVEEPVVTTDTVAETEPVAFSKKTTETSSLTKGVTQITTVGVPGVKTKTYTVTKTDGVQIKKELIKEEVTTAPIDEVTSVGTYVVPTPRPVANNCDSNYSPCVPNVSYDLDCGDVGFSVRVLGSDPHGFDRDRDGYGCESY